MGEMVDLKKAKEAFKEVYISRLLNFRIIREAIENKIIQYVLTELEAESKDNNFGVCLEGQRVVPLSRARVVRNVIYKWNGGKITTFDKTSGI
jgi:hypothetical protein